MIDRNTSLLETTPQCSKFSRSIVASFWKKGLTSFPSSNFTSSILYFLHLRTKEGRRESFPTSLSHSEGDLKCKILFKRRNLKDYILRIIEKSLEFR